MLVNGEDEEMRGFGSANDRLQSDDKRRVSGDPTTKNLLCSVDQLASSLNICH
jgi:hypothetical protein